MTYKPDRRPAPRPVDLVLQERAVYKAEGRCPICRNPVTEFRTQLALNEYYISGLCQPCQDATFVTSTES